MQISHGSVFNVNKYIARKKYKISVIVEILKLPKSCLTIFTLNI